MYKLYMGHIYVIWIGLCWRNLSISTNMQVPLCFGLSLFVYFRVLLQVIFLKLFNQGCLRVVRFLISTEDLFNTHVRYIKYSLSESGIFQHSLLLQRKVSSLGRLLLDTLKHKTSRNDAVSPKDTKILYPSLLSCSRSQGSLQDFLFFLFRKAAVKV